MTTARASLLASALLALAACSDPPPPPACSPACGTNAWCSAGTCVCSPGFVGNPLSVCLRAMECKPDSCKHGTCDDSTGAVVCTCESYWGGDDCGTCAPGAMARGETCVDDPCQPDPCTGRGTCSVAAGGWATCSCFQGYDGPECDECAPGYRQDNDICVLDACDHVDCNDHGFCVVGSNGLGRCACDEGYTGADCASCQPGWAEFPAGSGTCIRNPCLEADCGHGTCQVAGPEAHLCECAAGYEGATCAACAAQFVEFPAGSGTCVADPCVGADCGHGACRVTGVGQKSCTCETGYSGTTCKSCSTGHVQFPAGSGTCIANPCIGADCGRGTCKVAGVAQTACECPAPYTGATCSECADGYVEYPAGSGTCIADPCLGASCGSGTCKVTGVGRKTCVCATGYSGSTCSSCASGYVEFPLSSGTCIANPCAGVACGQGTCQPTGPGTHVCSCKTGYDGATCATCATGYVQYPAGSGTCIADPCAGADCGHGTCKVAGVGQKSCQCAAGYTGTTCRTCAAGYVEFPAGSGTCIADPCIGASCGHGVCKPAGVGQRVCECAAGYSGGACSTCATGYSEHPQGAGTCVADVCVGVSCGHGTCAPDAQGAAKCSCEAGYAGAACGACATGWVEFPAGSGTCVVDACAGQTCSGHGTCSLVAGPAARCTCDTGYAGATCASCASGYVVLPVGSGTCVANPCAGVSCSGATVCSSARTGELRTTGNCLAIAAGQHQCEVVEIACTAGPCTEGACRTLPAPGEIVFSELMLDPRAATAGNGQWIELHNATDRPLSLAGAGLAAGGATFVLPANAALEIAPRAYFVIGRHADRALNGDVAVNLELADLPLLGASGTLELRAADGTKLLDAVTWNATWWQAPGRSVTLSPAALTGAAATLNDDRRHWCAAQGTPASGDRASPGRANDACRPDWCRLQSPSTLTELEPGVASAPVFGQAYEAGLTDASDQTPFLTGQLGFGPVGSQPDAAWTWADGAWNPAFVAQNNEELQGTLTVGAGTWDYAWRMSLDGGLSWTACDLDGSDNGYAPAQAGRATAGHRVFFSEYVEGSLSNKAVEIFNGNAAALDLSTCKVKLYMNGSSTPGTDQITTFAAGTTVAAGGVFVVCDQGASSALKAKCNHLGSGLVFNGNDAVELECGGVRLDVIGRIGHDPGSSGWGTAGGAVTSDRTLRRKCGIARGDSNGTDAFNPATEWDAFAADTFGGLGAHCN